MADIRDTILSEARARQNRVYRMVPPPSASDGTIDCSLLVLEVAAAAGVPLPPGVRTAEQIRQATVPIGWGEVLPGDLLLFEGTYDAAGPAGPDGRIASHIGISLGAGTMRMIDAHARSGPDVAETDISGDYWQGKLFEARRLPGLADSISTETKSLRGIDVASYQGNPDWATVAASGISFAITKATQGTGYLNPTFARNWLEIEQAGIVRGAYHSAEPDENTPEDEAAYFLANVERVGGVQAGDLLALDLEDYQGSLKRANDVGGWTLAFLRQVEKRAGVRPLLYTNPSIIEEQSLFGYPALAEYPLWLADYQGTIPVVPAPWDRLAIWQHSSKGRVPGISGNVDLNVFHGSRDELLALGKPAGQAPAADPRDEQIAGLLTAVAHLADVVAAMDDRPQRLAEAQRVREQFVGPRTAA